jgi:hypothetical protein
MPSGSCDVFHTPPEQDGFNLARYFGGHGFNPLFADDHVSGRNVGFDDRDRKRWNTLCLCHGAAGRIRQAIDSDDHGGYAKPFQCDGVSNTC